VSRTMHIEMVDGRSHRVGQSPNAWVLMAMVVVGIAIALAAGLAASAVRVPADTPTPGPTVCMAEGMTGPCS
jgi:hypothetical protein